MKEDPPGSCWFLDRNLCRTYDRRFPVCCVYPYLLRRSRDTGGNVAWRRFSRMNTHGSHRCDISDEECYSLARETREFENAFLTPADFFLETIQDHFSANDLMPFYDRRIKNLLQDEPAKIMVYHAGELEKFRNP